jgi:predicted DCC family thiol-disulfide oxidoreductase YuxK
MNLALGKFDVVKPIVIFDGNCQLCNFSVSILRQADKGNRLTFIPFQRLFLYPELPVLPIIESIAPNTVVVISTVGIVLVKSNAIIYALKALGGFFRIFVLAKVVPRFIRDWLYDLIARNRYWLFGKANSCTL